MTSTKNIIKPLLPVFYIGLLLLSFPLFDAAFTSVLSYLRVAAGRIGTSVGVVPKNNAIMLGIYKPEVPYSMTRVDSLENMLGGKFDIFSFYQTWGEREEDNFQLDLMRAIDRHGAIALITWEPWITEFARNKKPGIQNNRTDLQEVADGVYDDYVRSWARDAVVFGKPFYLRFAHEMNNPQYPWSAAAKEKPGEFIDAWRHVWKLFKDEGAKNVLWVWSPKGTMAHELYPGGEYVDWVGTGVFNYGSYGEEVWQSFEYIYEPIYRSALRYEKPIMIAEIGCSPLGGNQAQWFADALKGLQTRYHETDAIVFYNNPADQTLAGSVIDWSVDKNAEILDMLKREVEYGIFKKN
ncbi:MAG: hypothetical protein HY033_13700 [Ignavibacteriae bacterium]|nr:hypothetical protein [Ignavibacteria bacterium]MBI3365946.1 hypothetical protein [Ignavibacteriota bacterium]